MPEIQALSEVVASSGPRPPSTRSERRGLKAKPELADIFLTFAHLLGLLPPEQAKVVQDILNCRTRALGGHVRRCDGCGWEEISYNSCRNRHCPKCPFLSQARWVAARQTEILPLSYFHVVFTLSHVLNPLILCNKKRLYDLLFQSAAETLKEVGARRLRGAQMGFTAVLHTWSRTLMDHPHLHVIVPGGGLSADGGHWEFTPENFLLPIPVLSQVFCGKFLSRLEKMRSELSFPKAIEEFKEPGRFKDLLVRAAEKPWVVYAKKPFAGPEQVLNYLGRYTHRVAISNSRILKVEGDQVTFSYRDSRSGEAKVMVLPAREFMRSVLLHVLPRGFPRMRHYGLLASRHKKTKLLQARTALSLCAPKAEPKPIPGASSSSPSTPASTTVPEWRQWLKEKTGVDLGRCPTCKTPGMRDHLLIPPAPKLRPNGRNLWELRFPAGAASHSKPELIDTS